MHIPCIVKSLFSEKNLMNVSSAISAHSVVSIMLDNLNTRNMEYTPCKIVTFNTLWANSADDKLVVFFSYFPQKTGVNISYRFDILCKLILFSWTKKKKKKKKKWKIIWKRRLLKISRVQSVKGVSLFFFLTFHQLYLIFCEDFDHDHGMPLWHFPRFHYENTPIKYIEKISPPKTEHFQIKNSDKFHIPAQNIDCGYSLEPPRRGGSNEYSQSMYWAEIRKKCIPL